MDTLKSMKPTKIICFYWQGDRWRDQQFEKPITDNSFAANLKKNGFVDSKLASQYVNNLYYGVKKHADRPFEFVCFTNERLSLVEGINTQPLPIIANNGVLPRLYMFSKESGLFGSQVLCLDIDVIIAGSLQPLLDYQGLFCTRSKFKPTEQHKLDGDIMSFSAGPVAEKIFWTPFTANPDKAVQLTQGRERYWIRHVAEDIADRWEKITPGSVVSWKWHIRRGLKSDRLSIISCHGHPRPHQLKEKDYKIYKMWNYVD
jgi:hypothetical protein